MAKAKSARKGTANSNSPGQLVSVEERQRMIAEAAYFRAMQHGFGNGDPLDDWLAAEREISRLLPSPQQQKAEVAAYEKLRDTVGKVLADVRGTVNADTVKQAFDKATDELRKTGELTADTVNKITASVRKDMATAAQKMGPKWEAFTEKSADLFTVWRDRGGQFMAQAASAVGEWLQQAGDRMKQQTYRTGEMTAGGVLECTACGEHIVLDTTAHLPPCPKCKNMEFRRV
jgi:hypothetical protein